VTVLRGVAVLRRRDGRGGLGDGFRRGGGAAAVGFLAATGGAGGATAGFPAAGFGAGGSTFGRTIGITVVLPTYSRACSAGTTISSRRSTGGKS
jgi:hypothetical protein